MQEMRRARELLLLVRRAPVQFPGHDVYDARERFGCALGVEEEQSDAPCDHVGRRQRVLVTNRVAYFRLDDCPSQSAYAAEEQEGIHAQGYCGVKRIP